MTETTQFDDETLMAFADGELDSERAALVEAAIERDATLAARVALFMETRDLVKAAHAESEPVPDALRHAVAGMVQDARARPASPVVDLASRRTALRGAAVETWRLPIAASLATAIAAATIGYLIGAGGPDDAAGPGGIQSAEVAGLLDRVPSGGSEALARESGMFRAVSTFRDATGAICREYEINDRPDPLVAVSCRQADGWMLRFAMATPVSDGVYSPASSLEALDTYLSSIDAGPALSAQDEAAALGDLAR